MKDWIISLVDYLLSNWQTVLMGGVFTVSIVVFILGCLKPFIKRWVSNSTVRKVIFAWSSVALNIPATALSIWFEDLSSEHFWTFVVINTVGTILVYFVYENTALRDALHWLGKKILMLLVSQSISPAQKKEDIRNEVEELLANPSRVEEKSVKSRYNNNIKI